MADYSAAEYRELVEAAKAVVEWGTPADQVPSVPPPYIRVAKDAYQRLVRALHLVPEPLQCMHADTCESHGCVHKSESFAATMDSCRRRFVEGME